MLNENRNTIFIPVQFMVPALRMCKLKKWSNYQINFFGVKHELIFLVGANMRGNGAFAPIASNASETRESSE